MSDRELTVEQITALRAVKEFWGTGWKDELSHIWQRGTEDATFGSAVGTTLRQIRNQFGPSWLYKQEIV